MSATLRLLSALLLVVAAAACGDDDVETSTSPTSPTSSSSTTSTTSPGSGAAVELNADPPQQVPAGTVTWEVEVTNSSDAPVTLTFPTAQRADAGLRTDDGAVVHRWGADMFFAQQITELTLEPGGSERFQLDDDLSDVEPGTYELVLELSAVDPPEPVVTQVEVTAGG